MTSSKKKIIFVIGPTASGKTALSIEIAKKYSGSAEIISADSRQVYRDLDLSTGKVTKEEMENIPHHLLDVVNPGEYFSVVDFTNIALKTIEEIFTRGNTPIICGGTGFYIDALLYKYELPEVKKNETLRKKLENKKVDKLYEYFEKINFSEAKKIDGTEHAKNKHRLLRRIEVVSELGYFPELKKSPRFDEEKYNVEIVQTHVNKDELKNKIYKRLIQRIDQGMIEEIKNAKTKYNLSDKYLEGLGLEFKWTNKFLNNQITKEEMIERLNLEICHYAKRQTVWFKRYTN